jgi:hypothetical protein
MIATLIIGALATLTAWLLISEMRRDLDRRGGDQ